MKSNTNQELYNELLQEGKIYPNNIKPPYASNIYNEYITNRFYEPSHRSFSIYFLKTTEFLEKIKRNPLFTGYIPPEIFNENDIWDLVNTNPLCLINIDASYIQPKMYTTAIMLEPRLLGLLPENLQTPEIVQEVINKKPLALQYVRDDLKYYYICQQAVSLDWRALQFVPPSIVDKNLIDIAKQNDDAFLLDIVERDKLNDLDFYISQLVRFPIEGATHLIATNLVNKIIETDQLVPDQNKINDLIYFIEHLDTYAPQFIFQNCDPKILMHPDKYEPLITLLSRRPEWITHLNPCLITQDIFEIAIQNNVYPKLESLNWTGPIIASAYTLNKKSFIHLPYNRLRAVGSDRITHTVEEALENGWVDQLPHYFFIDEVVNNEELRPSLIKKRESFSYLINNLDNPDWDHLLSFDYSLAEYRLLKTTIPTEKASSFFEKNIESYVSFENEAKTIDRTEIFLKKYPNEVRSIPREIQQNKALMSKIIESNPLVARYLDNDEIIQIFGQFN